VCDSSVQIGSFSSTRIINLRVKMISLNVKRRSSSDPQTPNTSSGPLTLALCIHELRHDGEAP
jgi:hypothetical protein